MSAGCNHLSALLIASQYVISEQDARLGFACMMCTICLASQKPRIHQQRASDQALSRPSLHMPTALGGEATVLSDVDLEMEGG